MTTRQKIIVLVGFVAGVVVLLVWMGRSDEAPKGPGESRSKATPSVASQMTPPPAPGAPTTPPSKSMGAILQTPIQFFGVVLDQDGNPVSGAQVSASVLNNLTKGAPQSTTSDTDGKFSIQSRGMSLHVEVSKSGYSRIARGGKLQSSSQGFDFGADVGRGIHRSDPAAPTVFQLRKAENPVALERIQAQPRVPRDGSPISVSLIQASNVSLRIRCRTIEDNETRNARYDWRCEVDIEGGGIQEAVDEHAFTAPEGGYATSDVIDMPKTLDSQKWASRVTKNYWLRFPDNTFAKIQFRMIARGDHFAVIEGFRNPTANIRNLEPKLSDQ